MDNYVGDMTSVMDSYVGDGGMVGMVGWNIHIYIYIYIPHICISYTHTHIYIYIYIPPQCPRGSNLKDSRGRARLTEARVYFCIYPRRQKTPPPQISHPQDPPLTCSSASTGGFGTPTVVR